jgi:hypothetical protein
MESWGSLIVVVIIYAVVALWVRHEAKVRGRISRAFSIGQLHGHYEGWLAHARGSPLYSMPPRAQEIEEVIGTRQGWGNGFYNYPDTDEFVQSGTLGNLTWGEWQARKLKELNDKYKASKG